MHRVVLSALSCAMLSPALATEQSASADSFSCRTLESHRENATTIVTTLAGVPAVLRMPRAITKPPIVLWHGFGPPDSEQALMEALPLDDVPVLKVYLGLPMFGARAPEGGMKEVVRRQTEDLASLVFEPIVIGAAKELPAVVRALRERDCVGSKQAIGLFGFSAGGAAALIALAEREVPIGAAVVLNASTGLSASIQAYERATKRSYEWTPHARELARESDAVGRAKEIATGNPALLIIHGADDAMLTPQGATALRDALAPLYKNKDRVQLQIEPGLAHAWTDATTVGKLRSEIGAWFDRRL